MVEEFQSDDGSLLTNPSETPLNIREELLLVSARGSISAKVVQQKLGGGGRGGSYDGACNGRSKYSTVADETLAAKRKGTRNSPDLHLQNLQSRSARPSSMLRWRSRESNLELEGDGGQSKQLEEEHDGIAMQSSISLHDGATQPSTAHREREEGEDCAYVREKAEQEEGQYMYRRPSSANAGFNTAVNSNGELETDLYAPAPHTPDDRVQELHQVNMRQTQHGSEAAMPVSVLPDAASQWLDHPSPHGGHIYAAQHVKQPDFLPRPRHVAEAATSVPTCCCSGVQPMGSLPTWRLDNGMSCHASCQHHYHHHQWLQGFPPCYPFASSSSSPPICVMPSPQHPSSHQHLHRQRPHWLTATPHYYPPHPRFPTRALQDTQFAFQEEDLYAHAVPRPRFHKARCRSRQPKCRPPFPSSYAPPYVLCQHCSQLLSVPTTSPPHTIANLLKLRCGLCMRISTFSTRHLHRPPMSSTRDVVSPTNPAIPSGKPAENSPMPTSKPDNDFQVTLKLKDMDTGAPSNGISLPNGVKQHDSRTKLDPEFAGFSSVQDWLNFLAKESLVDCPTTTGFGSDLQLQGPLDWQRDGGNGGEKSVPAVPGSPLHEHFGYKTPAELLEKALSSEDDENKARSETNWTASTSTTSTNSFKPPGFYNTLDSVHGYLDSGFKDGNMYPKRADTVKSSTEAEQDAQTSLASFLKRRLRDFAEKRNLLPSNFKTRVIVNGHVLSSSAISRAEEHAGSLRPGSYWYDCKAGFWGVLGGPCLGVIPPFIEELQYPMSKNCSNGTTQVYVNGRELHHQDLAMLSQRGLSKKPGRAYAIGFDGVLIDETTGQELKRVGKLAPTVERRGKGFGMYTPQNPPS